MPTYSYHCDTGDHDFDIVQRFADDALTVCPECGGSVRRVIQPVGVVFKGSGWYINDSRKSSSESDSARAGSKSADKKSDSTGDKPEKATSTTEKATASAGAEKSAAKAAD
ncbi:MAG: zinc ribbon domain-containing protein [Thermomicrobiales bacterium]|nr:zinc ribbon domain-containing protein [Thermomicrobiales bacterium]